MNERLTRAALLGAGVVLLAAILAAALPTCAQAQPPGLGAKWASNGWTTYTFLRDSLPDAGYDSTDCKMMRIYNTEAMDDDPATVILGDPSTAPENSRVLLYFDVSSIPSTEEVMDAVLRISPSTTATGLANGTTYYISCYRLLKRWYETGTDSMWTQCREGVNEKGTGINWTSAGASTDSLMWGSPRSAADAWNADLYSVMGVDTLTVADYAAADRSDPPVLMPFKFRTGFDATLPIMGRITEMVSGWHTGRYPNMGVQLACPSMEGAANQNITIYGSSATIHRTRPVLWVATRAKAGTGGGGSFGSGHYGY